MKHIYLLGSKLDASCGIDIFAHQAVLHTASSPSGRNVKITIEKTAGCFENGVCILNDNDAENTKEAEQYLADARIIQY